MGVREERQEKIRDAMRLTQHERNVLAGVVQRLKTEFHAEQVMLYGSAARDELDEGSDIDLLAILPEADWATKKKVCDMCFEGASLSFGTCRLWPVTACCFSGATWRA